MSELAPQKGLTYMDMNALVYGAYTLKEYFKTL